MDKARKAVTILMADDDPEDQMLVRNAWQRSRLCNDLRFVNDGEQLMDYLHRRGAYADPIDSPRPGVILLDLNMPKKDGYEALQEIKNDPDLRRIPVVVLTSSKTEEDIVHSYNLGVSGFIAKPVTFGGLVEAIEALGRYWIEIVELPT
jgi:CheY-like chemotaxis protein